MPPPTTRTSQSINDTKPLTAHQRSHHLSLFWSRWFLVGKSCIRELTVGGERFSRTKPVNTEVLDLDELIDSMA